MFQGKRILLTGGGGNVGSFVAEHLLKGGAEVTIFERQSHIEVKQQNLGELWKKMKFFWGDMRSTRDCYQACLNQDWILHTAAAGHVPYSIEYPREIWDNNANGTLNLLEAARARDIEKFININSSESYGTVHRNPMGEEHGFYPRSPYGASKAAAELLGYSYHCSYGMKFVGIRLFNIYGPRAVLYAVIPRFILFALDNKPLPIAGDGKQKRDYIYVEDAARGISMASANKKMNGEFVNLASGSTISIVELAKKIIKLTDSKSKIEYKEARPGEVPLLRADVSKAYKLFGWKPEISFDEGLKRTIEWYKKNKAYLTPMSVSKSL